MSCNDFDAWLSREEPDSAENALEIYFEENGIQCPECKFRYALSRGGCMHFKCLQCGFDFCSGCNRPYKSGDVRTSYNGHTFLGQSYRVDFEQVFCKGSDREIKEFQNCRNVVIPSTAPGWDYMLITRGIVCSIYETKSTKSSRLYSK